MPVCRLLHPGRLAHDGIAARVLRWCPSTVMVRLRALVMRLRALVMRLRARSARLRVLLTRLRAPVLRLRARMLQPAGAGVAPVGAAVAPLGAEAEPAGSVVAPAGAVAAPVGAGGAPAGAAAAPGGAVGALSGAVDERGRVVRRKVAAGGLAPFGAGSGWGDALVVHGEPLAGVQSVRVVDAGGCVTLARVGGRELPWSGVAAHARGHAVSSGGWRRTCECGITLGVAQWELQAGVCACGRRLLYKRARDGPSQSLDVPLVPRVPRPMPDGYG